jgi:MazG family protein
MSDTIQPSRDLSRLIEIMAALRDPETGCPWDLEQDFASIRHYTIEEAYEVADAIEREDYTHLREELGDLLLQPVYHAQMAKEGGLFDIGDVIYAITEKLIRRHPHVFGDVERTEASGAKETWEAQKDKEREAKSDSSSGPPSVLDDVPNALPALTRAEKIGKRVAKVGFDWDTPEGAAAKVREELDEIAAAAETGDRSHLEEEIGDMLFSAAQLARKHGVDPEAALRDANLKFARRFHHVEARCREDGIDIETAGIDHLGAYWSEVRAADKDTKSR